MTEQKQIYKCVICGNIIEVLHEGVGQLVCCNQPMELLTEKTMDVGSEKHVPVIEKIEKGIRVKVGSIPHPMKQQHYIEWIELSCDGRLYRKTLNPGDKPEAEFAVSAKNIEAREYCTIHGLWKTT